MPTTACPECSEEVFVDAESEQGDTVSCNECGADLEIVGLDPIELDVYQAGEGDNLKDDDFDAYDDDVY